MNTDIREWDTLKNWAWAKQISADAIRDELHSLRIVEEQIQNTKKQLNNILDLQENGVGMLREALFSHYKIIYFLWAIQGNAGSAVDTNLAFRRRLEAEYRARTHEPLRDLAAFREEIKVEIDAQIKLARDLEKQLDSGNSQDWAELLIELRDQSKDLAYHITQLIELTNNQKK